MDDNEELTIQDIVNLKSTCSKKVFDNFIKQKYSNKIKITVTDDNNDDDKTKIKKKSKEDLEFEKIFGCERPKDYKPSIDKRAFIEEDKQNEQIDEDDKPDQMTTKYRPRKFREIFKVDENVSIKYFKLEISQINFVPFFF